MRVIATAVVTSLLLVPATLATCQTNAVPTEPSCPAGDAVCEMLRSDGSGTGSVTGPGGLTQSAPRDAPVTKGGLGSVSGGGGGAMFRRGGMVMDKRRSD